MRCLACDQSLSDLEATRRYEESQQFIDLCNNCMKETIHFPNTIERADLLHEGDVEIGEDNDN